MFPLLVFNLQELFDIQFQVVKKIQYNGSKRASMTEGRVEGLNDASSWTLIVIYSLPHSHQVTDFLRKIMSVANKDVKFPLHSKKNFLLSLRR